jgi:hypothetical protein
VSAWLDVLIVLALNVPAALLIGLQQLTQLELFPQCDDDASRRRLDPGVLAGVGQVQDLCLGNFIACDSNGAITQLLSQSQQLTQLTRLQLRSVLGIIAPSAAACAALTASSKVHARSRPS